ncbi:DNA-binding protein, partial [Vibrio anguillarum]|nr:DNA-binding protein [Vibrio anguillarum]
MFALDGVTFGIKNVLVSFEREFKSQDMSGQSSFTDDAEQGEKA